VAFNYIIFNSRTFGMTLGTSFNIDVVHIWVFQSFASS
jgi:hypothetical protein